MNAIFYDLIAEGIMIVYLDNILIFTQILEKHHIAVWRVLEILAKHRLFFHSEKYEFDKLQIKYLDLVISKNQVEIDPVKMAEVCNQPISKNYTNLQTFLSFTNFYQRFICGFSKIACSFFNLTSNKSTWMQTTSQQDTFDFFKIAITPTSILVSSNTSVLFQIEVNSLDFITGTVLSQKYKLNGKQYLVVFFSKSLSLVEYNYKIYNKKILINIQALEEQ